MQFVKITILQLQSFFFLIGERAQYLKMMMVSEG